MPGCQETLTYRSTGIEVKYISEIVTNHKCITSVVFVTISLISRSLYLAYVAFSCLIDEL